MPGNPIASDPYTIYLQAREADFVSCQPDTDSCEYVKALCESLELCLRVWIVKITTDLR